MEDIMDIFHYYSFLIYFNIIVLLLDIRLRQWYNMSLVRHFYFKKMRVAI